MSTDTLAAAPAAADALNLPRGIVYRPKDSVDLPHQFGVWDRDVKRYAWESFSDKAKGLTWAKEERRKMDRGEATALRPLVSAIGPVYLERLKARQANPKYIDQVVKVIADLQALGADNMAAPGFAAKIQEWMNGMMARRPNQKVATVAAPQTKRRKLTITRTIAHFAMEMEGRPLRFDPLCTISVPKIEKHEKPVFTIPELRVLLSEDSRWLQRRLLNETRAAIEQCGGDKEAAANLLGVHRTTVYNRLAWTEAEDPWWLFTATGLYTGMRPSEGQFMEWTWIRWDEDVLVLPANAAGNKMKVERLIPLQPEYRAILMDRFKVGMLGHVHAAEVTRANLSARCALFQSYLKRCGLQIAGRGPHSLRHQHGALCTALEMHPMQIMLNMGHDNVKVAHDYSRTATRFRRDVQGWDRKRFMLSEAQAAVVEPQRSSSIIAIR